MVIQIHLYYTMYYKIHTVYCSIAKKCIFILHQVNHEGWLFDFNFVRLWFVFDVKNIIIIHQHKNILSEV